MRTGYATFTGNVWVVSDSGSSMALDAKITFGYNGLFQQRTI